jgi:hypothetical protein
MPSSAAVGQTEEALREFCALLVYKVMGRI